MPSRKNDYDDSFGVFIGNAQSQATVMTIPPGKSQGGPQYRHRDADQWLFVVAGHDVAIVGDAQSELSPGALLLIEAGNVPEIKNTGAQPLKAINVYVPPAFDGLGEPAGQD